MQTPHPPLPPQPPPPSPQQIHKNKNIKVLTLGAGQDVGRSCIVVTMNNKRIMFDCGMHLGFRDSRKFPDFSLISSIGDYNKAIDCVIITHFHLDHCGALPYFTEICGYTGPIFMTYPTRSICPLLLQDYRKIMVDKLGDNKMYTDDFIWKCMNRVTPVQLREEVDCNGILIQAFYAGHVLGAGMFSVRVGCDSVVYTGDYNMTPDRHLGSASISRVRPDLLITEATYGSIIRDAPRVRERNFLQQIYQCVTSGGKVLIPVFALGRAQELCILLESFWTRMGLTCPILFSAGLAQRGNDYYRLFVSWMNEKIQLGDSSDNNDNNNNGLFDDDDGVEHSSMPFSNNLDAKSTGDLGDKRFSNDGQQQQQQQKNRRRKRRTVFDFEHIRPFEMKMAHLEGPMVLFASPGMLHCGVSLEVFKLWADSEKNLVVIPGYCMKGTVGARLLAGFKGEMEVDANTKVNVRCNVSHLSFSAHADGKGILQLLRMCDPAHVMLVHGDRDRMNVLRKRIILETSLPVYCPANGETLNIPTRNLIPCHISTSVMHSMSHTIEKETPHSKMEASRTNNPGGPRPRDDGSNIILERPLKRLCVQPSVGVGMGMLVMPHKQNEAFLLDVHHESKSYLHLTHHRLLISRQIAWPTSLLDSTQTFVSNCQAISQTIRSHLLSRLARFGFRHESTLPTLCPSSSILLSNSSSSDERTLNCSNSSDSMNASLSESSSSSILLVCAVSNVATVTIGEPWFCTNSPPIPMPAIKLIPKHNQEITTTAGNGNESGCTDVDGDCVMSLHINAEKKSTDPTNLAKESSVPLVVVVTFRGIEAHILELEKVVDAVKFLIMQREHNVYGSGDGGVDGNDDAAVEAANDVRDAVDGDRERGLNSDTPLDDSINNETSISRSHQGSANELLDTAFETVDGDDGDESDGGERASDRASDSVAANDHTGLESNQNKMDDGDGSGGGDNDRFQGDSDEVEFDADSTHT